MYVTVQEYRDYAARLGTTLPAADADVTIQLEKASAYIDSKEPYLIGSRTERGQDHAYPRSGLVINGFSYDDDEEPEIVKKCQMELALELNAGVDLYRDKTVLPVIKNRVEGAVEQQFASPSSVQAKQAESKAMSLLRQLMGPPKMSISLQRV